MTTLRAAVSAQIETGVSMVSNKAPDPLDVALGDAVRTRRRALNLSQHALAERCGVSFQQVQKYENGVNRISFSRLVQIAHALDCRVLDLMAALDPPTAESLMQPDFRARLGTPGALELLSAFELLPSATRIGVLGLMRTLASEADADRVKLP